MTDETSMIIQKSKCGVMMMIRAVTILVVAVIKDDKRYVDAGSLKK